MRVCISINYAAKPEIQREYLRRVHDKTGKYLPSDIRAQVDRSNFVDLFLYVGTETSNFHVTSSFSALSIIS